MNNIFKRCMIFLLLTALFSTCAAAEERSREQMREAYSAIADMQNGEGVENSVNVQVAEDSYFMQREQALGYVNFIRCLSGLESVSLSEELNEAAQYAAELAAANGTLSHHPEKPQGMEEALYQKGKEAAARCNLILFNWNGSGLMGRAAVQFAQDAGENNQYVLGHRRWLLYPYMKHTGFGMAQDEQGRSYIAMYVMDDSAQDVDYDMICFPPGGAFPAEYMNKDMPWSVSFNPDKYDLLGSTPYLIMTERTSGVEFRFERLNTQEELEGSGQYFILSGGRYGDGPAYIFRPDLSEYDKLMYGYEQNQVWDVRIEGMKYIGGTLCEAIEYTVEIASLTPIEPAAVEIMPRERVMTVGESAVLSAQVIPQWADDLSVEWSSTDQWVAQVDADGTVHANGKGTCEIIARSVNGREDRIKVEVR